MQEDKDNVSVQASDEVSYDTLVKAKTLLQNRDNFYFQSLCNMMDDTTLRLGRSDLSVLEVGFNNGKRLRELSRRYEDAFFIGLEVREKPVSDMKNLGFDCRLVETELFNEFFNSGEMFDVIYGFAVLHHLSDPYKSLESLIKLLKPGGVLMFIREGHPFDVVSHLHTTILGNWEFEKNTFKMNRRRFKELLSRYSTDFYVKYDNNGIAPCFRRLNSIYCKLKMQRVPFWNGITLYARIDSHK